jgi:saccharopine dehydrogenase-like NADP-dependent oxidoreductase
MRVLVVGAGGVGAAFAAIAQRREAFEHVVLADVALERAKAAADRLGEPDRFSAERVDASSREDLLQLIGRVRPDAVLNACDPRFNEPIFDAAFAAKVTYLDMAMTLSHPHPERPHELPGEMLGDLQLARHEEWEGAGILALVGIGVEPATRPTSCSRASPKSASATARTWSWRAMTSRRRSRSGRRSRSA